MGGGGGGGGGPDSEAKNLYQEFIHLSKSNRNENIYTLLEFDNTKGYRISTINNAAIAGKEDERILREISLDGLLGYSLKQSAGEI